MKSRKIKIISLITSSVHACRNLGNGGHNSISHPHAQFPKNYNLEDVLVSHYCYRHYNQSCPTCHTHGLLEYSCSFCIENTCEQETCGAKWGWLNQLEECRQTIIQTETYNTNLDRLQAHFDQLISGNGPMPLMLQNRNENQLIQKTTTTELNSDDELDSEPMQHNVQTFNHDASNKSSNNKTLTENTNHTQIVTDSSQATQLIGQDIDELEVPDIIDNGDATDNESDDVSQISEEQTQNTQLLANDNKLPPINLDYRIYCADPTAELNKATLRCYAQCPPNYNRFGVSCFSNCATPQKDEFSTYCIEPEVRKPIELFSSCAEDCNENNIHDFCFACPEGMHKKDCQCVKSEKIEFREILERSYTNAIMLLID